MKLNDHGIVGFVVFTLGALLITQGIQGAPFTYTNRDLMLCFRKTGQTGTAGSVDVEINIGQASRYYNAAPGTTVPVTQFSSSQLTSAFDSLNNMSWSVGGDVPAFTGDANFPDKTLWATAPRSDPATAAPAWQRGSSTQQGTVASKINSVLFNASSYSSSTAADATNNTATVVWIPVGNAQSYGTYMGPLGNYSGTFQGNVENTTPSDFVTSGRPSRSDLYQLLPGSGAGTYLGYFELHSDGTVIFVAPTLSGPPPPLITAVGRTNNTTTISFTTSNSYIYSLRFTNAAGLTAPVSTWTFLTNIATGNNSVQSVQDTTTDPNRMYRIEVH